VEFGNYFTSDAAALRVFPDRNRRFTIHVQIGKPLHGNHWVHFKEFDDMLKLLRVTTSALALAFLYTSASLAAQELIIKTDQTQLLNVTGSPGAVVIGNPSIADATVHGNKIFIHGRAFGSTNLIILDQNGNQLVSLDITVQQGGENNLALYKAGARYTYVCAPACEATLQAGDQVDWFGDISKMDTKKSGAATGKTTNDSEPAPVAQ
jgi:Pilus formation protein N terminal region